MSDIKAKKETKAEAKERKKAEKEFKKAEKAKKKEEKKDKKKRGGLFTPRVSTTTSQLSLSKGMN